VAKRGNVRAEPACGRGAGHGTNEPQSHAARGPPHDPSHPRQAWGKKGGAAPQCGSGRFCSSAAALAVLEVTDHREDGVGDDEAAEEDVRDLLPLVSLGCKFRSARVWLGVGPGGPGPGARPRTDSLLERVPAHHADALRGRAKEPCTGHRERHGCQLQKGNKRDLTGYRQPDFRKSFYSSIALGVCCRLVLRWHLRPPENPEYARRTRAPPRESGADLRGSVDAIVWWATSDE
jgi:hypothetical protein